MRYLLDTHTILWWRLDDPRLPSRLDSIIGNASGEHEILVSVVSLWEIAIKRALGKLEFEAPVVEFARTLQTDQGFRLLSVEVGHLGRLEALPFHHRDPFDRLLIAQAIECGAVAMTNDPHWKLYPLKLRW